MRIHNLYVKGIALQDVLEFTYEIKVNEHAKAYICGEIKESDYDTYVRKSILEETATIMGLDVNGNEEVVFAGTIKNMKVNKVNTRTTLSLELVSATYLMDMERKRRVHQDVGETYSGIIQELIGIYPGGKCDIQNTAGTSIGKMYVQYEETDWEFSKRMASRLGKVLIPLPVTETPYFEFGCFENSKSAVIENIMEVSEGICENHEQITIVSRDFVNIGDQVTYEGKTCKVYSANGHYENQVLLNEYVLRNENDFSIEPYENQRIIGASLDSTIHSVSADQVTVVVTGDPSRPVKNFPYATIYSSPDGSGWYCMPEPGDTTRLYFPSTDEDEAYVISSTHTPVQEGDDSGEVIAEPGKDDVAPRSNPDHKSFKTKYGKEIVLAPEKILITNNNGMYVELNDSEGITIFSDKKIKIESNEAVNIVSNNDGIKIIGKEEVRLQQNTTYVSLKENLVMKGGKVITE